MAKLEINSIPSENTAKMPIFTLVGLVGVVLGLIAAFMDPSSLRGVIMIAAAACSAASMYYIYDSLKKGMANFEVQFPSLCSWCGYIVLGYNAIYILTLVLAMNASSVEGATSTGIAGLLMIVLSIVYLVLYIILGVKLCNNYSGKLGTLGILFVASPVIMLLGLILAIKLAAVVAVIGAAVTAYQLYLAYSLVCSK